MYDYSLVTNKQLKAYRAELFNLSKGSDVTFYEEIMLKAHTGGVEIVKQESHFDIRKGTVKIHLEWMEFETVNESIYKPDAGDEEGGSEWGFG